MKKILSLALIVSILIAFAGCIAPTDPTTLPSTDGVTLPTVMTQPPTTIPLPTTEPTVPPTTEPIPSPEVQEIQDLIRTMMTAHIENMYLYTDHDYSDYTILALNEEQRNRTIHFAGQEYTPRDFLSNMNFLSEKERYWNIVLTDRGIYRTDFSVGFDFSEITIDGDYLVVEVNVGLLYRYIDSDQTTGEIPQFRIDLLQIDGKWYICDVFEHWGTIEIERYNPDFKAEDLLNPTP